MSADFDWIHNYKLFLFDMDGLLVNTEKLHYLAYQKLLRRRGYSLDWDFPRYCQAAHYEASGLKDQIYAEFPELAVQEPRWEVLYAEKKEHYMRLLKDGEVCMMPGVTELLYELAKAGIKRCVVTHSPKEQVDEIRKRHSVLNTIPHWITRLDYKNPKPDPECYQKAIDRFAEEGDKIIGFEDSPRGLRALLGTRARAVLVCPEWHPGAVDAKLAGVLHFANFKSLSPRKLAIESV